MKRVFVLVVLAVFARASTVQANIISNPGFEDPLGSDNWTIWGGADVETSFYPPEGYKAVFLKNAQEGGSYNQGVSQVTAPGSILGSTPYLLSALFYKNDGWSAAQPYVMVEFFDAAGALLGGAGSGLESLPGDTWVQRQVSASSPARSSYARVTFAALSAGQSGSLGADDFSLLAIPEPTTVALFGLLGVLCAWLRRALRTWTGGPRPQKRRILVRTRREVLRPRPLLEQVWFKSVS